MKSKVKSASAVHVHLLTSLGSVSDFLSAPVLTWGEAPAGYQACLAGFAELPDSCRCCGVGMFSLSSGSGKEGGLGLGYNNHRCPLSTPLPSEPCAAHISAQLCWAGAEKPPHRAPLSSIREMHGNGSKLWPQSSLLVG